MLDASPAVCSALSGQSSCGWSDHFSVTVAVAMDPKEDGVPYGPFPVTPEQLAQIVATGKRLEAERFAHRKEQAAPALLRSMPSASLNAPR